MRLLLLLCLFLLLPLAALAESPRLLFDQGHRQAFLIEKDGPLQLSALAATFRQHDWQVSSNNSALTEEKLAAVDALIISGAFHPLNPVEIEAVLKFVQSGGKLAVMIHIGQPLLPLLHKLGVDVGNRVINEKPQQPNGKSIDFQVRSFKPHPLLANLQSFAIYGGWPLQVYAQSGRAIASSSTHSWVDMNNDRQFSQGDLVSPFAVVIAGELGRGRFAVFADDAIFQNQFLRDGNKILAENLARWLKDGDTEQVEI